MPISEDTAALVAAQLTVAWATRAGEAPPAGKAKAHENVMEMYGLIRAVVRNSE